MSTYRYAIDSAKKPAVYDWHKADIIAALSKRGTSLQRLSKQRDYYPKTVGVALYRPWPKAERIIADALGLPPQAIWPSRYNPDGTPRSGRGERGLGRHKIKHSTGAQAVNVHVRRAA